MGNQQVSRALTDKDVEILVKTSGKSENYIRQWYKEFHEESENTDRMNKRQFQIFYTNLKKNPNLEQISDHIFRAFDTNHSGIIRNFFIFLANIFHFKGTIDFSEFLLAYIATTDGTKREKLEYAFAVYDINDDQLIDKKEATKILKIICRIAGVSEIDAKVYTETLMLSFDTNHDKVLTKHEFIEGCLHDSTLGKLADPFHI
jgi:Ca2+-binding EF-hand superfamily protein